MEYIVRPALPEDLPGLKKLLYQVNQIHADGRPDLFKDGGIKYTDEELKEILRDPRRPVWVCAEEDQVLGYVFCILEETRETMSLRPCHTLYIDDLCVDEQYRRKHIGKKLYEFVLDVARENGCDSVTLNVWSVNPSAEQFYQKMGMQPLKTYMETILK